MFFTPANNKAATISLYVVPLRMRVATSSSNRARGVSSSSFTSGSMSSLSFTTPEVEWASCADTGGSLVRTPSCDMPATAVAEAAVARNWRREDDVGIIGPSDGEGVDQRAMYACGE